ncbi:MAG: DUF6511 domain-containing protein [Pseudomonas sp.]
MAPLSTAQRLAKPLLPIQPTADEHGNPTTCRICSMRAMGVGVGFTNRTDKDAGFLCVECAALVETVRSMRRFDVYELRALDGCVESVGEFLTERGITDLALLDELDAKMLCKRVVMAFGDTLRGLLRSEAPF